MAPPTARHLVLALSLVAAAAASTAAEQPPVRTYTTADGLAADTVFRVVADSRGTLWFCTSDGLSRFDGYAFASYSTRDGLPDRRVSDVCETRDGGVWVATPKGLCRFDPDRRDGGPLFVVLPLGDDPEANDAGALAATPDGALWCGTRGGLFRLDEGAGGRTPARVDLGMRDGVDALAAAPSGGVWAGTNGEVRRAFPDGRVEAAPLEGAGRGQPVTSVYVDSGGRLWAGTASAIYRSAGRADEAPVAMVALGAGAPVGWGNAFFESREGVLWAATTTGLWRETDADGAAFERRAALDAACDREVWDVAEDRDGDLWLATTCGVLRLDRYGFTNYTKADGLAATTVDSIFESAAGDLVVTTNQNARVVHRFDGARFTSVAPRAPDANYFGWGWGQTVIQDREGAWWVPSGNGVFRYPKAERPDASMRATPERILPGRQVFRVFEDSRGDVWLATTSPPGLFRRERATGRVVDVTAEAGGAARDYTAFRETRDGAVWIGTAGDGLLRYMRGAFERVAARDGAPAGWIRDLYVDGAGRLWIASGLGGLARVDAPGDARPRFVAYTAADGLSSDDVWCVVEDLSGRIYAGTTRGVDRIDLATGSLRHFTSADGLPKSQPQVAFRDRRGSLWFGSAFGLARLDPDPPRDREPPRTLVTGLRVAGVSRPVPALGETVVPPLDLAADENSVSVEFVGIGASLGEALRYQYKLEGSDRDWSPPTAERAVTLAGLGAGSYRLLVRAVDADGTASPEPATVAFTVAAPLWRRWWFLCGAAALAALVMYALYAYRVRRLVEIERVRTHIATDLHDDIGANLTKIVALGLGAGFRRGEEGEAPGGEDPLASIVDISRESVTAMSDIVWAVNPVRDSFRDLVRRMRSFANEAFEPYGVLVRLTAPESDDLKLDDSLRRHVYLVFKEAVSNAVRHAACARVDVALAVERGRLVLTVADDGRGFDATAETYGNGLVNMRKRAEDAGGTLDLRSSEGSGTTVALSVPIRGARRFLRRPPA